MDREDINAALSARIGAVYQPPVAEGGPWDAHAQRFEVLGDPARAARRLDYLQVRRSGNFGNNYIQLVHALAVAEAAGVRRVAHRFPLFGSHKPRAGPRLIQRRSMPGDRAGLSGAFFLRRQMAALQDLPPDRFLRLSDTYLRPALRLDWPAADPGVVALNLRGGADVFENRSPNPTYGQPPLSFYQGALGRIAQTHPVRAVNIVHQDLRNPVLEPLTDWLQGSGLDWRLTTGDMLGDARALMAAEHIVMGWTTFTAALAILSRNMTTVTVFRSAPLRAELAAAARHFYVVEDAEGGFIPADGWANTPEQRRMLVDYPVGALTIRDQATDRRVMAERLAGYRVRRAARYGWLFGRRSALKPPDQRV